MKNLDYTIGIHTGEFDYKQYAVVVDYTITGDEGVEELSNGEFHFIETNKNLTINTIFISTEDENVSNERLKDEILEGMEMFLL